MDFGEFYLYKNGTLAAISEPAEQEVGLAVADSLLIENGATHAIEQHKARFTSGVAIVSPEHLEDLPSFFEQSFALIPRTGRWWPRFELHLGSESPSQLFFRLRKAPDPLGKLTVWTLPEPDPRINPSIKGPDLSLGQQLRRKAKMNGADEAIILNSEGYISEGALSSLLWWRDDVLFAPSDAVRWLPSVTRNLVLEIAKQSGFEVRLVRAKPSELIGCEVWLLSALNGIREVEHWIDLGGPLAKPKHLEAFNKRMRLFSQQI